jgi:Ribonuclease G/E
VLKNEVAVLVKNGETIMKEAEHAEAPAMLWEGNHYADIEFPAMSKRGLDEVRRTVAPTIDGHHYYKACGERVSTALEMAEKLLEKGYSITDVEDTFKQTVEVEYPHVDSWITIEHVKLDGKIFHLGPAFVEDFDLDKAFIRFRRVFKREGVYDGLKTIKQPDDYAVTEARIGDLHFKTQYFSRDGKLKGTYINLNTPIELYPNGIRYVDLEVDVCIWPDGRMETIDQEKLQEALSKGVITEKLATIVKEKTNEVTHEATSK